MKSILIDMGNSFSKVAIGDSSGISQVCRVEKGKVLDKVSEMVGEYLPERCVISSVSGGYQEIVSLMQGRGIEVTLLSVDIPLPIEIDYATPKTLGADRIAAAIGAHSLFPEDDCIVFDLGTAITIDFVDKNGVFKGGNISPGMSMRFKAMNHYTNKLPLVEPEPVRQINGQSTVEAINNGVILGIVFEIEEYIRRFPSHKIIFTGGDSIFFAKILKSTIFAVCNLVLIGLSNITQTNENR
ncbi:MAG: type III pantothenate kinase [Bacteroidales bacterium]|nr:type III pantothenate kinase [Bacteroidales bacterium]